MRHVSRTVPTQSRLHPSAVQFAAEDQGQASFAAEALARRWPAPLVATAAWLEPLVAGVAWALLSPVAGDVAGRAAQLTCATLATLLAAAAGGVALAHLRRPPWPSRAALEPGERLLAVVPLEGPGAGVGARAAAGLQVLTGAALVSSPIAVVALHRATLAMVAWAALMTAMGTWLLARGLRWLLFARAATHLGLTSRRLVAWDKGRDARFLSLAVLRYRPVVGQHGDGSATVAFALTRQPGAGLLPLRCLWGFRHRDARVARAWAQAAIEARAGLHENTPCTADAVDVAAAAE